METKIFFINIVKKIFTGLRWEKICMSKLVPFYLPIDFALIKKVETWVYLYTENIITNEWEKRREEDILTI